MDKSFQPSPQLASYMDKIRAFQKKHAGEKPASNIKNIYLDELDLKCTNPPHHVVGKREMYAKIALLMFYPFRQWNDLKYDGSYWRLFRNELEKHINKEDTVFWKKGFEILQNILDRSTLEKHVKRVFMSTTPDDECSFRVRLYCKPHYWVSSCGIFKNGIIQLFCP
jgi:hypothetical protein